MLNFTFYDQSMKINSMEKIHVLVFILKSNCSIGFQWNKLFFFVGIFSSHFDRFAKVVR